MNHFISFPPWSCCVGGEFQLAWEGHITNRIGSCQIPPGGLASTPDFSNIPIIRSNISNSPTPHPQSQTTDLNLQQQALKKWEILIEPSIQKTWETIKQIKIVIPKGWILYWHSNTMSLWFTMRYVEVPTFNHGLAKRLWKTSDLTTKLLMWALQWIPIPRVHVTTSLPPRGGSQARLPTKAGYFWGQVRGGILNSHHTESAVPIDPCHVDCAPSCMCHIWRSVGICWSPFFGTLVHSAFFFVGKTGPQIWVIKCHTVDGQNPASPRMMTIPSFIGF